MQSMSPLLDIGWCIGLCQIYVIQATFTPCPEIITAEPTARDAPVLERSVLWQRGLHTLVKAVARQNSWRQIHYVL